ARFLDTQKAVMTAYLQGGAPAPAAAVHAVALPSLSPKVVQEPGVGGGKRETASKSPSPPTTSPTGGRGGAGPPAPATASKPPAPVAAPAPDEKPKPDRAWITAQLQGLISKRTGYPKEMLGLDIDLEADLGIDSIKRVEILAEMAQ